MDKDKIWKVVLAELEIDSESSHYKTIFKHSTALELQNNKLVFSVPSDYTKKMVESKYINKIQDIVNRVRKKETFLQIVVKQPKDKRKASYTDTPMFQNIQQTKVAECEGLYPYYTFERYVVGSHNRLAHAVALAAAENPGVVYNPFFIYSKVGLGKTHLVQALGNQIHQIKPDLRIVYISGEQFMNELLQAIRGAKNNGKEFRDKFRGVDVLIIDDVQFLAGKDATQEELFHTFNSLHMAKKQIVLTSDRPPREIPDLEERLSSRFSSGMMADIQKPDIETRMAILRTKKTAMGVEVEDEVVDRIAELVDTNIRELEGAFLQVVTASRAKGVPLTLELANEVLTGIKNQKSTSITVNDIVKEVSNYYDVKISDIKGLSRQKQIAQARQMCMFLLRNVSQTPFETIGDILGGRDHSTIIHGVTKVKDLAEKEEKWKNDITKIEKNLAIK